MVGGKRKAGAAAILLAAAIAAAAAPAAATVPGSNGPIVWQSQTGTSGGLSEIWIMRADGSGKRALTENAFNDERPAISPDRSLVAFQSYRAGDGDVDSWEIYVLGTDGGTASALTDDDDTDFTPAFSPDGSEIVWMKQTTGVPEGEPAGQDLWVMNSDGSDKTNLTVSPAEYEAHPEYSPDGSKIVFVSSGTSGDNNDVWVMDADGTDPVQLTSDSFPDQNTEPTWSPDGSKIAWAHNFDVWVMDADGSDKTPLGSTAPVEDQLAWSPDGSVIALVRNDEIATVPATGPLDFSYLTSTPSVADSYPSWAPAGMAQTPPDTRITARPRDTIKATSAEYRFRSTPAGASFECKLDSGRFRACGSPKRLRRLSAGRHRFAVRAVNSAGADPSPARDSFRVKKP